VRVKPAANFKSVELVQFVVRTDSGELEDLVEPSALTGGLGVVKNEGHDATPFDSAAACLFNFR
jgi:hypothetical protein